MESHRRQQSIEIQNSQGLPTLWGEEYSFIIPFHCSGKILPLTDHGLSEEIFLYHFPPCYMRMGNWGTITFFVAEQFSQINSCLYKLASQMFTISLQSEITFSLIFASFFGKPLENFVNSLFDSNQ